MSTEALPKKNGSPQNAVVGRRSWLNRFLTGQSGARLAAELEILMLKIQQQQEWLNTAKLDPPIYGFDALSRLLTKSASALKAADLEMGWSAYHAALCLETQIYHQLIQHHQFTEFATGMFHGKAVSVYTEANQKLQGWRRQNVNALLGENNKLKPEIELGDLLLAEQTLYEHHRNIYRRLNIIKGQFTWLALFAILALAGWVMFLVYQNQLCQNTILVYDLSLTIQTLIFGVLGACTSGILTLANSSTRQRIPEKLLTSWVSYARPLVGAISALAVVIFVLVGILEIGEGSTGLYLAAAFTAGFSERLLIKTIEGVVGKAEEQNKNESTPTANT